MTTNEPKSDLGAEVRRRRIAAGLTQAELAMKAGVADKTVGDLERGARSGEERLLDVSLVIVHRVTDAIPISRAYVNRLYCHYIDQLEAQLAEAGAQNLKRYGRSDKPV